ncbi:MAG TPA: hypothetical protein PLN33_15560 [Hyphomonadaceae bacterium]|jgi:hypothetical protein|nr:hypothetical protein [Hyphomonadaceae bacterium]
MVSPPERLGHNNGPDIPESLLFKQRCGTRSWKDDFALPDAETGLRWTEKAEELGLSYAEYLWNCLNAAAIRHMKTLHMSTQAEVLLNEQFGLADRCTCPIEPALPDPI